MSNLGTPEIIVLAIIVLWLFGTDRLKDLAKGIGQGAKEIKDIKKELENPIEDEKKKT